LYWPGIFERRLGIVLTRIGAGEEIAVRNRTPSRRVNRRVGDSQILCVNAKSRGAIFEQGLARRRSRLANLHAAATMPVLPPVPPDRE